MKKLTLILLLCITTAAHAYTPGVYTSEAQGQNGAIKVSVTLTDDSISAVEIVSHSESTAIAEPALTQIPANIVKYQSLGVDSVSGATVTSKAIIDAVTASLTKAGGNMLRLKQPAQISRKGKYETVNVDVVVLGSGFAGFSAAISAASNGASVLLLEKLAMRGGSSGRSAGILYHATDPEEGYSASEMIYFLMEESQNKANPDLTARVAVGSADIYRWMLKQGLEYKDVDVMPEGAINADTPMRRRSSLRIAIPAPAGVLSGMRAVNALYSEALKLNVAIRMNTTAEKLVLTKGAVTGVIARTTEGTLVCNAKAVIIATGGYDHNPLMQRKYAGPTIGIDSETSVGNTGDGIRMAEEVGAATVFNGGKAAILTAHDIVGFASKNFIIVNSQGRRIVDELRFYDKVGEAMAMDRSVNKRFYRVYDSSADTTKLEEVYKDGKAFQADSVEELAKLMNVSVSNLTATIEHYNNYSGRPDPDFAKSSNYMIALKKAPFYAVETKPTIWGTIGGIKINEDAEVIDKRGKAIPGLYAAGETANGVMFYRDYPYSGSFVTFALATGRIAGYSAAGYALK